MHINLTAVNEMDCRQFVETLGQVFEHSPWIAKESFHARPFADIGHLHQAMVKVVQHASSVEQLALLRAHPELAGQEARQGELTDASTDEQASAGLNALSSGEMARIAQLNAQYRKKFGFPFIIAVRNHTKQGIFELWDKRLTNNQDAELATCLEQVFMIARIRLDAMLGE